MKSQTEYAEKKYPTKSGIELTSKEMAETLAQAAEYAKNQMQTTTDKRKIKKLQDRLRNIKLYVAQHDDIMIDLENRRVVYAILSFGGFLGIGDKHFAIPLEALSHRPNERDFTLDVSKDVLEKAEGFDKDNIPSNREALASIYTHYGYKPYWQTGILGLSEKERQEETESERMTRIKSESHVLIAKEEVKAEESKTEKAEESKVEEVKAEESKVEKAEEARAEVAKLEGTKVEESKVEAIHPSEQRGGKKRSLLDTCK
jgi:hypothetical protein